MDLCRLAGVPPVGVIAELVNDDGTVKRGPQVNAFADEHGLLRISVADLIAYRQAREKLVTRTAEFPVPTLVGEMQGYSYITPFDQVNHLALVHGRIGDGENVLVRLHRADPVADAFTGAKGLQKALERIRQEGRGILVYLRDGTVGVPPTAMGSEKTSSEMERDQHWREVGLGAQILRDLGVTSIRLLASKTRTYVGLSASASRSRKPSPSRADPAFFRTTGIATPDAPHPAFSFGAERVPQGQAQVNTTRPPPVAFDKKQTRSGLFPISDRCPKHSFTPAPTII